MKSWLSRHWGKLAVLAAVLIIPVIAHLGIAAACRIPAPDVRVPEGKPEHTSPALTRFGPAYSLQRGKLLQVGLSGTPEEIGYRHARLLYDQMVNNEGIMLRRFEQQVSFGPARTLLLDLAQLRFRHVDEGMSEDRKHEIAAGALGFQPDPYSDLFPTFQRFIYLNSLYDISLSFEDSPLIGCTSFVLNAKSETGAPPPGPTLLARAFDFEVDPVFDENKAVFLVREQAAIPFASVAWPGLVGVVSGMNEHGLAVVVHGARAREPLPQGEPVVHSLRRVLSEAHNVEEALVALDARQPMVSHIVILADADGRGAAVERVPGLPNFVKRLYHHAAVTNHFEGRSARDAKNIRVRERTSSVPRRERADELLASQKDHVGVERAVELLRDRKGKGGKKLELGDRRAIDALIATHGVVMDTKNRVLWVSESPHLLGRFVAFDLKRLLKADYDPEQDKEPAESIAEDPLLTSPDYKHYLNHEERADTEKP